MTKFLFPPLHLMSLISLLTQNVQMASSVPPLTQTITRNSTTLSWPTAEQMVTPTSSVCPSRKEPVETPATVVTRGCLTVRWTVPLWRHHRTVICPCQVTVPPLTLVTREHHSLNLQTAFDFCAHLPQRILRKKKAGHPHLKAESLRVLSRKVDHSSHPLPLKQSVKRPLVKVYPNLNLSWTMII